MKDFDLFKFITIGTILAVVVVLLFQIDYGTAFDWEGFTTWMEQPLEWTCGHYLLLIGVVFITGK